MYVYMLYRSCRTSSISCHDKAARLADRVQLAGVNLLGFSKAFGTASPRTLVDKRSSTELWRNGPLGEQLAGVWGSGEVGLQQAGGRPPPRKGGVSLYVGTDTFSGWPEVFPCRTNNEGFVA